MVCHDCKRERKKATCMVHNPVHAQICKDCCITKFKGHKCSWWSMCWC